MDFGALLAMGITWHQGLAAVFPSGLLLLVLTFPRIRERVIDAIPEALRHTRSQPVSACSSSRSGWRRAG